MTELYCHTGSDIALHTRATVAIGDNGLDQILALAPPAIISRQHRHRRMCTSGSFNMLGMDKNPDCVFVLDRDAVISTDSGKRAWQIIENPFM